jgi:LacI family transcriptional regulator
VSALAKHPYSTTIDDVAKRAGVSISTVSRVINQTTPVSQEIVSRVQAAMMELHYVPRTAARNLASRKTNTLGLMLTEIQSDFFVPMLSGIEAVASEAGFDLLISTSGRRAQARPHQEIPLSVGAHNADGLLIFANSLSEADLAHCYHVGLPMVLIYQASPASTEIPCVTIENKAASRNIVNHLIEVHGRRHIAFLRGPERNDDSYWREIGYRESLAAHQIPFDPNRMAQGDFDRKLVEAAVKKMLAAGVEMDAIFSGDDEGAIAVLDVLKEAGRRVPEEIAVVGFDDLRLSAYLTPPLTTVRAPTEKVGYQAAQQLVKLIRTGQADSLTLLPTEIVIRRSCGCA